MWDYNPTSYADYWRTTIVNLTNSGARASRLNDLVQSLVTSPGTGSGYGPFAARSDYPVVEGYKYVVLVSYDRGSDTFGAGAKVRFDYSGASMTVTGPRTGF